MISLFEEAIEVWGSAQVCYEAPPRGPSKAWVLVTELAEDPEEFESLLIEGGRHQNQLVAAYCLQTLFEMRSESLATLGDSVLSRSEKVTFIMGSFSTKTELGAFARKLKKHALRARSDNG
jgi:hypothetical protein